MGRVELRGQDQSSIWHFVMRSAALLLLLFIAIDTWGQDSLRCGHERVYIGYDVWWDSLPERCDVTGFERVNPAKFRDKELKAYKRITDYMSERGGDQFLQRLELRSVRVNRDAGKCGKIHFILRYHFNVSKQYYYRFALYFDHKGRLVGNHQFPDQNDISGFWNLISICDAVKSAVKVRALDRPISKVELRYDQKTDQFIWVILGRPAKSMERDIRGRMTGDFLYQYQVLPISALTGDVMTMRKEVHHVAGGIRP